MTAKSPRVDSLTAEPSCGTGTRHGTAAVLHPAALRHVKRLGLLALLASTGCLLTTTVAPTSARADFGFLPGAAGFDGSISNQDGSPDTQAGSHPYAMRTSFNLKTSTDRSGNTVVDGGNPKDIEVQLPPGLVGDPTATRRCNQGDFLVPVNLNQNACPDSTAVGVAKIHVQLQGSIFDIFSAVYNVVPSLGTPAEFGFPIALENATMTASVRTGGDYGLTVRISDVPQALSLLGASVTFWGNPTDSSHDPIRGHCLETFTGTSNGNCPSGVPPKPFLSLPTSCAGPQTTTITADSWQNPGNFVSQSFVSHDNSGNPIGTDGCDRLDFSPTLSIQPDTTVADSPSGLSVDLHVPQNDDPNGLAESNLKKVVVTLPAGVSVSPSAASGLAACSPIQIGLDTTSEPTCPDASKVGAVEVHTPLLADPLSGSVYLAQQNQNPFGSLFAIYLVAEGDGVLVKLAGHVMADPVTGQLTTTFDNNPQLPFSALKLDFFGGPRGVLATPEPCGTFTTATQLTPWSGQLAATPADSFNIDTGCVSGFSPSFSAGTINNQAGAFSPLSLTFSRTDVDQDLEGITVQTPPGLLGILKSVVECPEPQASQGACGPQSRIGNATAGAGPGPDPFYLGGAVYLTGPYKGAPFGLSVVVPAIAGPFNLGNVIVRASITVDPHTSALTITSDPLPSILQGIPLHIKTVNVTVDRPGFMFNPTNCNPLAINASISSLQGATASVSSRFQAANCATLPFKPKFTVLTQGKTSKANGASLHVKVTSGPGQANIGKVKVDLPKQLPSRLTTLQKACPDSTFNANPAACPAASMVGSATAVTPILKGPLTGPAYLVSHAAAAFPDLVIVLQGEGITLDLVGNTDIKKGITTSSFNSVPDAPVTSFDLVLPQGPHSALAAHGNVCSPTKTVKTSKLVARRVHGRLIHVRKTVSRTAPEPLSMPTMLTGQNGAVIRQTTKVAVSGCPKHKKAKKHTRQTKGKPKRGKR